MCVMARRTGSTMTTETASAPRQGSSRSRWTALNILLMVIGFVVFWPLGLAVLAWILWGDQIARVWDDVKAQFQAMGSRVPLRPGFSATGNVAFDEYRAAELKRLEEERRRLEEMRAEFESFLKELRRVKDQEEFDRFMASYRNRTGGEASA
jgi:hypothetical protein